ncbi:hypothetical protein [Micromonospora sp. DT31]|uniref:hypothetical protein n=1 Tax=Micromonospora sp. DT31 TaxID=3393434 RepID=UPI003CE93648
MAIHHRRPARDQLIHHSDRGTHEFGRTLRSCGVLASMGSAADCYGNAMAETFFATLKPELVYTRAWPSRHELDAPLTPRRLGGPPDDAITPVVNSLIAMATELLHTQRAVAVHEYTRDRLKELLRELVPDNREVLGNFDANVNRFEFTLVLAVLHNRLNFMTTMWPASKRRSTSR